jgi:surfactin synthase thioesterase subunit
VLGATGGAIGEHFGVDRADVELWAGTLSKGLAGCGGYIGGSACLIKFLKYTTPGFIFSGSMPPPIAAAVLRHRLPFGGADPLCGEGAHRGTRAACGRRVKRCGCSAFIMPGGGKLAFNSWNKALGPGVEVVPVEIANRERFATLRQLVDEVNEQLRSALDDPHMFFGHSFGALLAYRLACIRAAEGAPLPRAVLLSSYAPPHLPPPLQVVEHLDEAELSCPIPVLGGSDDPLVSEADLQEWRSRTSAEFSVQILRGGHFYLRDRQRLFATLRPLMSGR